MSSSLYKLTPAQQVKLQAIRDKINATKQVILSTTAIPATPAIPVMLEPVTPEKQILGVARTITLNEKQQQAEDLIVSGKSCCIIGAAGTGKTTAMRSITRRLLDEKLLPSLTSGTKHLHIGNPGIAVVSYTRKATNNIRHAVVHELRPNTLTCHKLIEFAPVWYEEEDPETGELRKRMRFEPTRNQTNPLPTDLLLIIYEESSMLSVDLYQQIQAALPHKHQEVFLGDIQQLPPTFGAAILGYKLLSLPVVELTEVYRQAAANPGLALAWAIISGDTDQFSPETKQVNQNGKIRLINPSLERFAQSNEYGSVKFILWQKQFTAEFALKALETTFNKYCDSGEYNPKDDIILCPYNVSLGTIELNKAIAQHLGTKRDATVHEVIAGFNKHYLAVGDRVLYDKEDAFIIRITPNREYMGASYQPANKLLTRWGNIRDNATKEEISAGKLDDDADFNEIEAIEAFMNKAGGEESMDDRVNAASHIITVRYAYSEADDDVEEDDGDITLTTASEINGLLGGYAITIHKSQGSEYGKVFLVLHHTHSKMVSRELLYTAITRMKKDLVVICEPSTFSKGVRSQRIKGNTLQEKAEFFKGKPLPAALVNKMQGNLLPNMPIGSQEIQKRETGADKVAAQLRNKEVKDKMAALRAYLHQQFASL